MDYINNLEQWMQVNEFPNYMISSCGRVMNITTFQFLKPDSSRRYPYVLLYSNGNRLKKSIHRLVAESFILNLNNLPCVDHKDRNKLNSHISNLRWCTRKENQQNISKQKNSASIYKGVCFNKDIKKWVSRIYQNNQRIHLGYFLDEVEAAHAYDLKAKELFKEFAVLNF